MHTCPRHQLLILEIIVVVMIIIFHCIHAIVAVIDMLVVLNFVVKWHREHRYSYRNRTGARKGDTCVFMMVGYEWVFSCRL